MFYGREHELKNKMCRREKFIAIPTTEFMFRFVEIITIEKLR